MNARDTCESNNDKTESEKSWLTHICFLLGIEPKEGETIRQIGEFIESSKVLHIEQQYK
jgi:hypothetical protein